MAGQKKIKKNNSSEHLISEQKTEREERKKRMRLEKRGIEVVQRPELVGCQRAQCDREGPSALPNTQDGRCRSRLIFIQLS